MRATLLTAAYKKSKNLRAVQELAGHASPDQTQVYVGVSRAEMQDALDVA
jgi:site-specific recombinase XerC